MANVVLRVSYMLPGFLIYSLLKCCTYLYRALERASHRQTRRRRGKEGCNPVCLTSCMLQVTGHAARAHAGINSFQPGNGGTCCINDVRFRKWMHLLFVLPFLRDCLYWLLCLIWQNLQKVHFTKGNQETFIVSYNRC